jgi:hypothetical protein
MYLAPDRLKPERITDPNQMIHSGRRQAHTDVEVNLLVLGDL